MKKTILSILFLVAASAVGNAFCGFYVAKAGSELYNNKSEVILVRDGNQTTITMSNDFKGNVKDFAMVIPVPNILKREDISIADQNIFSRLDAYSAPRLVEYYDVNPCRQAYPMLEVSEDEMDKELADVSMVMRTTAAKNKVTIEAKYNVEEYEILILSAEDSDGLKNWLLANGYKIPAKAESVLEPYIKSKLKFFVVKVNLNKYNPQANGGFLRPLQIKVNSDKFMLPIRLGMANSKGDQDMIVYAFSKNGRVECTNYRTVKMPSNRNVPTFIKPNFGNFYKDVFRNAHSKEGRDAVFLEYAWNVTPSWGGVKCDPCVGNPPYFNELSKAGVSWVNNPGQTVYFTRLHVRYAIDKFPEDLFFQETPNKEIFQARYIITHPAQGDITCKEGVEYLKKLKTRRRKELSELGALAQWDTNEFYDYVANGTDRIKSVSDEEQNTFLPISSGTSKGPRLPRLSFILAFAFLVLYSIRLIYKQRFIRN